MPVSALMCRFLSFFNLFLFFLCRFGRLSAGFAHLSAGFEDLSASFAKKDENEEKVIEISRKGSPSCALNDAKL